MTGPTNLSVAQAQEAAKMGAYIEMVYGAVLDSKGKTTLEQYAGWIKAVGPSHIILSTDLGGARPYPRPMPTAGLLEYMTKLHQLGVSVADLNTMAKTNPAKVLGLECVIRPFKTLRLAGTGGARRALGDDIGAQGSILGTTALVCDVFVVHDLLQDANAGNVYSIKGRNALHYNLDYAVGFDYDLRPTR